MLLLLLQNDPWGAARSYAEAEKLEEQAEGVSAGAKACRSALSMMHQLSLNPNPKT
jgi:hypothetical protein